LERAKMYGEPMPERSDRMQPGRPHDGQAPAHEHEPVAESAPAREPTLSAERRRKPDGRLLILYHWAGEDG
jgi:hypothetical protein